MKLEINHLAPYLPYGLKAEIIDYKSDYVGRKYDEIIGIHQWSKNKDWCLLTDGGSKPSLEKIKPILRPLSALETNMEDGHEYIELLNAMYGDSVTDFNFIGNRLIEHTSKDKGVTFDRIEYTNRTMPYYIMEFLFQHHFDIFELIPQGLAIAYNDL